MTSEAAPDHQEDQSIFLRIYEGRTGDDTGAAWRSNAGQLARVAKRYAWHRGLSPHPYTKATAQAWLDVRLDTQLARPQVLDCARKICWAWRPMQLISLDNAYLFQDWPAVSNRGAKFCLVGTCVLTRWTFAEPLRCLTGEEVTAAFFRCLQRDKIDPRSCQIVLTDLGHEFVNSTFRDKLAEYGIEHEICTSSVKKCSISENRVGTLKRSLAKALFSQGHKRWVELLQDVVCSDNIGYNRTLEMSPAEARNKPELARRAISTWSSRPPQKFKFDLGQWVRVDLPRRGPFSKKHKLTGYPQVYKIVERDASRPPTYLLEDHRGATISGRFEEQQMQAAPGPTLSAFGIKRIVRRDKEAAGGPMALVEYKFLDQSSWVPLDLAERELKRQPPSLSDEAE